MNRSQLLLPFCALFLLVAPCLAGKKEDAAREALLLQTSDNLRREVDAIKKIRAEKLDQIEALETKRWEERYRQNQAIQEHQEAVRALDGRYSKASTDLGRLNDEVVQDRNATEEMKGKAEDAIASGKEFATQVAQAVDKTASDLSSDYPIGLDARNLDLSKAREALGTNAPQVSKAVDLYFDALANRYALTLNQEFTAKNSQVGSQAEVPIYRLRLGTIFLGEIARDGIAAQSLQRTGAIQGRVFEWRDDLSELYGKNMRTAIMTAQQGKSVGWIPLDLLQSKSVQATTRKNQESSWFESIRETFKSGGPIMYPLAILAIISLLLSLERWITFVRRGNISTKMVARMNKLLDAQKVDEAHALCKAHGSSLGRILAAILEKSNQSGRASAEKAVRQTLLREQPLLERRMGMLGAFGTSAPLLGLLGTVGGMISLFTVLTDVGTNDAKMLAGGIAEALVCTEAGLIIAIPVLLLHGWLTEKLDIITSSLSFQSMALLNRLWPDADEDAKG
jgi:biopolymer transport protein ExbB